MGEELRADAECVRCLTTGKGYVLSEVLGAADRLAAAWLASQYLTMRRGAAAALFAGPVS